VPHDFRASKEGRRGIKIVCEYLTQHDVVQTREREKCGFDLLATRKRSPAELHVEVKGTSLFFGSNFFITRNEYVYMKENPTCWRLALVSDVLGKPSLQLLREKEVREGFSFEPIIYMMGAKKPQAGQRLPPLT
jgi:Domain of unknown function (DUF3883)